jgi:hypothetical protein
MIHIAITKCFAAICARYPRAKTAALSRLREPRAFSKAFIPPDDVVLGRRLRSVPPRRGQEEKYLVRCFSRLFGLKGPRQRRASRCRSSSRHWMPTRNSTRRPPAGVVEVVLKIALPARGTAACPSRLRYPPSPAPPFRVRPPLFVDPLLAVARLVVCALRLVVFRAQPSLRSPPLQASARTPRCWPMLLQGADKQDRADGENTPRGPSRASVETRRHRH